MSQLTMRHSGRPGARHGTEPWYRNPYVWLVVGIPAAAVLASVATAIIAIRHPDALVVGDYYRQGKAINRVLARDRRAAELGLVARIAPARVRDGVVWTVRLDGSGPGPDAPVLVLAHGTRPGLDRRIRLEPGAAPGLWHSPAGRTMPPPAPGPWHVQLETPSWRLSGRLFVPLGRPWPGDVTAALELRPALQAGTGEHR